MKITRLHLILVVALAALAAGYLYQMKLAELQRRERALEAARIDLERRTAELQKQVSEAAQRRAVLATDAVAIAGEYRIVAVKYHLRTVTADIVLRSAKERLAAKDYAAAFDLSRQAIAAYKTAPRLPRAVRYRVRPNDTLWTIAARALRSGERWREIWQANRRTLPDPRRLRPRQMLTIPVPDH